MDSNPGEGILYFANIGLDILSSQHDCTRTVNTFGLGTNCLTIENGLFIVDVAIIIMVVNKFNILFRNTIRLSKGFFEKKILGTICFELIIQCHNDVYILLFDS